MVSPKLIGEAGNLRIQTFVNGELRQDSDTNVLLFNVTKIISFISQGTTFGTGHGHNDRHAFRGCIRHEIKTGMVEGWEILSR